ADGQELDIPTPTSPTEFEPESDISYYDLAVPPSLPQLQDIEPISPTKWLVEVPADPAVLSDVQIAINQIAPQASVFEPDTEPLDDAANVRTGIWIGTAIAGGIAIISLLITAIDNGIS